MQFIILLLAFIANHTHAEEQYTSEDVYSPSIIYDRNTSDDKKSNLNLTIQQSLTSYEYSEPGLMKISGFMPGALLSLDYQEANSPLFASMDLEFYHGTILYDGALQNGTPIKHNSRNTFISLQPMFGAPISIVENSFYIDLSLGLGYRFLLEKGLSNHAYRRDQTYTYIPLQAQLRLILADPSVFTFGAEYDHLVRGANTSYLKDVVPEFGDLEFEQGNGRGYKFFAGYTHHLPRISLTAQLFHNTWSIADSSVVTKIIQNTPYRFVEPKNKTSQTGLAFGVVF